tara:strand:+ start:1228 stop:1854 length:627 start_codon:yes stop_codon:yes gene_type:complete
MADYDNYDAVSWSLGTPITAGRMQQITTNIGEVKSATDRYAKGVIVMNSFTTQVSTETNGVLHTGLTDGTYVIANINNSSGSGSSDQRITLADARYYKVNVSIPDIKLQSGHAGSDMTLKIIQTVSSTDTVLATYKLMTSNPTVNARYFGAGDYSAIIDTTASSTPHEFKATIVHNNRVTDDAAKTYEISASATAPIRIWVEDIGSSA